jgi:hypothetical protein
MLRPEQLLCEVGPNGGSEPRGTVSSTEYYGHDAIATVAIAGADGLEVVTRCAGYDLPPVGAEVTVRVEGSALAYARVDGPET